MNRKCPRCSSPCYDEDALRCWNCGERLEEPAGFLSAFRYTKPRLIFVSIALAVVIAFLMLLV